MDNRNQITVSRARASTLVTRKWMSFVASIWIMAISGSNFDFSIYSSTLKTVMDIDQIKLNNLAVASDLGKLMGWVSGIACMALPTWVVLAIAVSLGFVGYGVQWLVVSGIIHPLPYFVMYMLCMMAGNSICWLNTVCFRVAISNFPSKRGIASGINTSYSGLSTVIYTNLASVIVPDKPSFYLLLNALVPVVVCAVGALCISVPSPNAVDGDEGDEKNLYIFTFTAVVTAIYSIVYEFLPHGDRSREGLYMGVLAFLLLALLYVPLKETFCLKKLHRNASSRVTDLGTVLEKHGADQSWEQYIQEITSVDFSIEPTALLHQNSKSLNEILQKQSSLEIISIDRGEQEIKRDGIPNTAAVSRPAVGEEHGVLQLIRCVDFWLYYFVYFCGGTVGLVYINNLGQIIQSLGYSKTPKLVSLVSSLGFLGRIASGLPDYFKCLNRRLPRTAWLGLWTLPMVPALFMLAFFDNQQWVLYASTAIIGTAAGAITSVAVPTTSELFGMQRFGVNHNILISNIAFGSLLFGNMAGFVYDSSATTSPMPATNANMAGFGRDGHFCIGKVCYAKTFLSWGCICSLSLVLSLILSIRTRKLYKNLQRNNGGMT